MGGGAAWAAPINDAFDSRLTIQFDDPDTRSNVDATIEPNEPLTSNDPTGAGCDEVGEVSGDGRRMTGTLWWKFTGDGRPVTVSTLGSNFDTIVAVYDPAGGAPGNMIGCNDDVQPPDATRPNLGFRLASELRVGTVAGREYTVQVGGCCATPTGDVTLRISPPPANDTRAAATAIPAGGTLAASSLGATVDSGELTSCGAQPYAKTVWFRYTAPAAGTAAFSASGFDTVLTVYPGGSGAPIACNDDAVESQFGASRIPAVQPAGPPVPVAPGEYLIQVGGYYDPGFSEIAARGGPLQVQVEFTPDLDLDDDGVDRDTDCDDRNPRIRPGATETHNDGADENCDGIVTYDRDGDGALAPPAGADCADLDSLRHPGANEVRGNRVDENCDGETASLRLLTPTISFVHSSDGRDQLIRRIDVVPTSEVRIQVRCRGRGCRFRNTRSVITKRKRIDLMKVAILRSSMRLRHGRPLRVRPGAAVEVLVMKRDHISKSRVLRVRRKGPGTTYHCIGSDGRRRACPSTG